jgi:hypothetical protein
VGKRLMSADWQFAFASVIGMSHENLGLTCQDAGLCRTVTSPTGESILLAVASDGAGSAPRSQDGAALTVLLFMDEFGRACQSSAGIAAIDRAFVVDWLSHVKKEISIRATSEGLQSRDFACTVLGALVGERRALFFQLGDGAIVISNSAEPNDCGWVFWPQHGEFANETNFITQDNAEQMMEFEACDRRIDRLSIFTDGLERLVLDYESKTAHAPFFNPLFSWLTAAAPQLDEAASIPLVRYLTSETVNKYTDDDKTLILATRRLSPTVSEIRNADSRIEVL